MFKRTADGNATLFNGFDGNAVNALLKYFGTIPSAAKPADQIVSTSTTLVTDNDLNIQLQTGVQLVTYNLYTPSMTAAGGLKLQLALGDGLTVNGSTGLKAAVFYYLDATAPAVKMITAAATPVNGGTTSAWTFVQIVATVDVQNPGTLLLQWAQQAASGSTTVALGSTVNAVTVVA